MRRLLHLLFYLIASNLLAQVSYKIDQSIPVQTAAGVPLDLAWAGGLNSVEYNTVDLNNDGKEDLVLFDRMGKKVITFLNSNNLWKYAPAFEYYFPPITNWLLLRDFNCDGRKDIFTGDVLGIRVYQNTQSGSMPSWKALTFFAGGNSRSNVLLTKGFSGKINIQLQYDDMPAISDADGDGDLDIFNPRFVGGGIEYHRNLSVEKFGTCDSLDYERITQKWASVTDCHCGTFAFNDGECTSGGRVQHAGGKSLLFVDANNDQRPDMLFSEAECPSIFQLQNDGTAENPIIHKSSSFPAVDPVEIVSYPAAYLEDVDFDGKKDLVVSSNNFTKDEPEADLAHSNILYKNSGTNTSPVLTRVQDDFLQNQMIDIGDNAVPSFADYDGDGDYDLFVSSNSSQTLTSRIQLFENTGNQQEPAFTLVNEDYLSLSRSTFYNVKVQFVDVNADNFTDLAFTASSLDRSGTKLHYILNKSQVSIDISASNIVETDFAVNYTENVFLTDVDADGKVDLLAGRNNGQLELWLNSGATGLKFRLVDDDYLRLNTSGFNQNISISVTDADNDELSDLIYTDGNGKLSIITAYRSKTNADSRYENLIVNELSNELVAPNIGTRTFVTTVNLFNTTKPAIAVGTTLGGIILLKNTDDEALSADASVDIFPNPVQKKETLRIRSNKPARVQIYSSVGERIRQPFSIQGKQTFDYNLSELEAGVYFFKFYFHDQTFTKRVVSF